MKKSSSNQRLSLYSAALLLCPASSFAQEPPTEPTALGANNQAIIDEITPVVDLTGVQATLALPTPMNPLSDAEPPKVSIITPQLSVESLEARAAVERRIKSDAINELRGRNYDAMGEGRFAEMERHRRLSAGSIIRRQPEVTHPLAKSVPELTKYRLDSSLINFESKLESLSVLKGGLEKAMKTVPRRTFSEAEKILASDRLEKILNDKTIKTAQLVSVNLEALANSSMMDAQTKLCNGIQIFCRESKTAGWTVSSPSVKRMYVTLPSTDPDEPAGDAFFVKSGDKSIGVITVGASTYTVNSLTDGVSLITTSTATNLERNLNDVASYTSRDAGSQLSAASGRSDKQSDHLFKTDSDCPNPTEKQTIEILMAITGRATQTALRDGKDLTFIARLAEEQANFSFQQSNINGRVSITKIVDTDYVETGDFKQDVDELTKPKGVLQRVYDERKRTKADVVVLVVENPDPRNCGIASAIGASKENATAVVNWRCLTDRFSFIHEIGHLAGAWHDPITLGSGYTILPPYASGYVTSGNRPVATIMAYTSACSKPCGRGYFWANPFLKSPYGDALGTVGKNYDACLWRKRLEPMAKFNGG